MNPGTTPGDILALVWGMRGLVQAAGEVAPGEAAPGAWPRFLDIHLAGLRAAGRTADAAGGSPLASRSSLRNAFTNGTIAAAFRPDEHGMLHMEHTV